MRMMAPISDNFILSYCFVYNFRSCIYLSQQSSYLSSVYNLSFFLFQVFDENDVRRVRFVGRQKEVNMQEFEEKKISLSISAF